MSALSEIERQVLGNVPCYRTDKQYDTAVASMLKADSRKDDDWRLPRSISVPTIVDRLSRFNKELSVDEKVVTDTLSNLQSDGLVAVAGDAWAMTKEGLEALTS